MDGNIRIARILGIPIEINYTWLIVFGLIAWSLAAGYFPRVGPDLGQGTLVALGVAAAALFFAALLLHELAHSYVAMREGIPVRGITLFIFGGVAQMAKEPPSAGAEFRMAIAGPLTSIAIGLLFGALAWIAGRVAPSTAPRLLFQYLAFINVAVALFNLIPAFPLDGGRVFRSAVWYVTGSLARATRLASGLGQVFAYALMGVGLYRVLGGDLFGGLWMLFIGWFLLQAAQAGYQQVLIGRALRGVEARDLMRDDIAAVPADLTVAAFVHDYLLRGREPEYCVVDEGRLRGQIGLEEVRRIPRERWDAVRVADAMTAEGQCLVVRASQSADDVLMLMTQENAPQVVVREDGRLVGTISQADLLTYIRNRIALER